MSVVTLKNKKHEKKKKIIITKSLPLFYYILNMITFFFKVGSVMGNQEVEKFSRLITNF